VDGTLVKPSHRVEVGQVISGEVADAGADHLEAEELALSILHEDPSVLVIDKPPDLIVHPGSGRRAGTLANALKFHVTELSDIGGTQRPGIVHRLDRDTSGVMVVAKSNRAHFALAAQFQARETTKEYYAIVEGEPDLDGDVIDRPLGRSRHDPSRVVIDAAEGKPAQTEWQVVERFDGFTLLECHPRTGRTHQLRVHLRSIGHPIVCDATYGRRPVLLLSDLAPGLEAAPVLSRQALHAFALEFDHPLEGRRMRFEAPLPADLSSTLEAMRRYRSKPTRKPR
jgi:23S rRNA pseudouridine1911/1915/1917 synthase